MSDNFKTQRLFDALFVVWLFIIFGGSKSQLDSKLGMDSELKNSKKVHIVANN